MRIVPTTTWGGEYRISLGEATGKVATAIETGTNSSKQDITLKVTASSLTAYKHALLYASAQNSYIDF